ncbi:MAG: hypothetical protein R2806_01980 [Saprospiraceae bacterium]
MKRNDLHKLIALAGFAYIWGCEAPGLLESTFSKPVEQVALPRVEQMPNAPAPYQWEDWHQKAIDLDTYLYDTASSGPYQPFIWTDRAQRNFPEVAYGLYMAVGDVRRGPIFHRGVNMEAAASASNHLLFCWCRCQMMAECRGRHPELFQPGKWLGHHYEFHQQIRTCRRRLRQ